jgi:hypothetical protein
LVPRACLHTHLFVRAKLPQCRRRHNVDLQRRAETDHLRQPPPATVMACCWRGQAYARQAATYPDRFCCKASSHQSVTSGRRWGLPKSRRGSHLKVGSPLASTPVGSWKSMFHGGCTACVVSACLQRLTALSKRCL